MDRITESEIRQAVVGYADTKAKIDPSYSMLVGIPNEGRRSFAYGKKLKLEGLRAGFPDTFLFLARGSFIGAAIEFKRPGGVLSANQKHWIGKLTDQGYLVALIDNIDAGIRFLDWYISGAMFDDAPIH